MQTVVHNRDTKKIIDGIGYVDSLKDMNLIIDAINKRNRYLRTQATRQAKKLFDIGDAIFIRTPNGLQEATLLEIKRSKCVIRLFEDGIRYTCRLSQIERKVA